jgi:dTDP-4-dehydrorhamnose reductase
LEIAEVFGLDKSLVNPIKTKDLNQLAERPMKCCMDINKITKVLKRRPLSPIEGLTEMKNQLENKREGKR